jgi:hypothetical protein
MGNLNAVMRRSESDPDLGGSDQRPILGAPAEPESRVTPVMPIPDWLREIDEQEARAHDTHSEETEHQFWDAPPRYSRTSVLSLAPAALRAPSRWRVWGARLLFGTIFCAVVGLLGFETTSVVRGASLTSAVTELRGHALARLGHHATPSP